MLLKSILSNLLIASVIFINAAGISYADSNPQKDIDLTAPYAIILTTSNTNFSGNEISSSLASNDHIYYSFRVKAEEQNLHQLRLGFFKNREIAEQAQQRIHSFFKKSSIVKTSLQERNNAYDSEVIPQGQMPLTDYLILSGVYNTNNANAEATNNRLTSVASVEPSAPLIINVKKKYESFFVINLKTTNNLGDFDKIRKHPDIVNHAFYLSELEIDGRLWYQYRLGFFIDADMAREKLTALTKDFPLARLIKINRDEKEDAAIKIRSFFAAIPGQDINKPLPPLSPVSRDQLNELMKQASQALSDKNYLTAINLFSQILRYPEHRYSMDAQEFLGFARELQNQAAYAKVEYERYLSLYPESSGADRVRQRLAGLLTARRTSSAELRDARRKRTTAEWISFGSFSQFYRRYESQLNDEEVRENLSIFDSSININSRYRSENYDMRARFIGSHNLDYTGAEKKNAGSISSLYFDAADLKNKLSGRIGRQSSSKGGVLGRFDGAELGYKVNDWIKLNTVTGLVVDDTNKSANSDKSFIGINTDLGTFLNAWDFNLYYIQQNDGQIVGRQAVGSEIRYFHPQRTLFTLIDYDTMFKSLNTLLAIGNWKLDNKVEINATIDIRKSPTLTTSNALQGRTEQSVDELLTLLSEEEIKKLAVEQTATSKSFTFGINNPLNNKYQLSNDLTISKLSSTIIAGVPVAGTDSEFFYNLQLTGNDVITDGDSAIFGMRYSDTSTATTSSLSANLRFPVATKWRINPRYRFDLRKNDDGTDQTINALSMKADFRWKRHVNFELDIGGEKSNRQLDTTTDRTKSYYFSMGYRYDFL